MSKQKLLTLTTLAALGLLVLAAPHARAAAQEGMVAVRDPQTGKLRAPTPDELRELHAHRPQDASLVGKQAAEPAAVTTHPNGARSVRLGEQGLVYDVVTRGADGKLTSHCVQGEAAAKEALTAPQSAPLEHKEHGHEDR